MMYQNLRMVALLSLKKTTVWSSVSPVSFAGISNKEIRDGTRQGFWRKRTGRVYIGRDLL